MNMQPMYEQFLAETQQTQVVLLPLLGRCAGATIRKQSLGRNTPAVVSESPAALLYASSETRPALESRAKGLTEAIQHKCTTVVHTGVVHRSTPNNQVILGQSRPQQRCMMPRVSTRDSLSNE